MTNVTIENCGFKNGDRVYHVNGGTGEIRTLENDWSTNPPTITAVVRVADTCFDDVRKIPVEDLRKEKN